MEYIYAFVIGGVICMITQFLSELKIPFSVVAIIMMLSGAVLTPLGIMDKLSYLGAGGAAVTAMGCGNGAYGAGAALAATQNAVPLVVCLLLNIALIGMGAICGVLKWNRLS